MALAHNNLGNALRDKGALDEAIACFKKALELDPKYAMAHNNLGVALNDKGDVEGAIRCYRTALDIDPKLAMAHNNLAWLLATCPDPKFRDAAQAVQSAEKAVKLAPKEGSHWNTLGVAHYRAGDWKAAVASLEKSMVLGKGGVSFDWFFLAMAHWQRGDKEQARKWYDQAVPWMEKNKPQDEELRRFRAEAATLLGLPTPPKEGETVKKDEKKAPAQVVK